MPLVTLPEGEIVTVSNTPEEWWTEHGASGYLDPRLLFPDPQQPRKIIGGGDWKEFAAAIAAAGVREVIHITPLSHAPWVTEQTDCPFLIVSGHRRHLAALEAGLGAVLVIVKIYPPSRRG